jgi:hypothetical protein
VLPGDLLFATQDGCHRETDHFAAVLNDPNEDITGDDLKSFRAGFVDVHYEGIDFVFLFDFVLLLLVCFFWRQYRFVLAVRVQRLAAS